MAPTSKGHAQSSPISPALPFGTERFEVQIRIPITFYMDVAVFTDCKMLSVHQDFAGGTERVKYLLLFAATGAWTVLSLKYLPIPFLWALLALVLACTFSVLGIKRTWVQIALLNIGVVALILSVFEMYAYLRPEDQRSYPEGYKYRDDVLGSAPTKGVTARVKRTYGDAVVYDVTYSIGLDGLRVPPPATNAGATVPKNCVLFFGDSFTFGEGLNDDQTIPYRVETLGQGEHRAYNFGFHGYGAQQMLASLERGRAQQALECQPTHVIYTAIPDHVARAVGFYNWGRQHPRYILRADGSVIQSGYFSDDDRAARQSWLGRKIDWNLSKSFFYGWIAPQIAPWIRPLTQEDVKVWIGIVRGAERFTAQRFPQATFHVLLWSWPTQMDQYRQMLGALRDARMEPHLIDEILPDNARNPNQYQIPIDRHPNAKANEIIARYIQREILTH